MGMAFVLYHSLSVGRHASESPPLFAAKCVQPRFACKCSMSPLGLQVYGSTAFDTTRVSMAGAGQKIQGRVIDFAARRTATRQLQAYLYAMQASGTYDQDDYGYVFMH